MVADSNASELAATEAAAGGEQWEGDLQSWDALWMAQNTPTAVYQSRAFFKYLVATEGAEGLDVLVVRSRRDGTILGLVPTQRLEIEIPFSLGKYRIFSPKVCALRILGSEPMVTRTREAYETLFESIFAKYPDVSAVEMDAVRIESYLWQYLFSPSSFVHRNYLVHVLHGVRDCHTIHLPASVRRLRAQMGRKLSHNLERQERVLERYLGAELELVCVDNERAVSLLFQALSALRSNDGQVRLQDLRLAARFGFLYCYVLHAAGRFIGVTMGTRSKETYRVTHFFRDKSLERFSVGTTMWVKVLRALISEQPFSPGGHGIRYASL